MVEYGNGIGEVAGQAGGGAGGGPVDLGTQVANFVSESAHRISSLPPEALILIVVVVFVGLIVLRRAF